MLPDRLPPSRTLSRHIRATLVLIAGLLVAMSGAAVLTGRDGELRLPAGHRRHTVEKAR